MIITKQLIFLFSLLALMTLLWGLGFHKGWHMAEDRYVAEIHRANEDANKRSHRVLTHDDVERRKHVEQNLERLNEHMARNPDRSVLDHDELMLFNATN